MFTEFTKIKKKQEQIVCVCVYIDITLLNTSESAGKGGNAME